MRQPLEVIARGQLGDDPAEFLVQLDLGVDDVAEDPATTVHDRDRSFVAAGLDPEGERAYWSPLVKRTRRRPLTSESIRSRFVSYARRNRGEWVESDHITIASSPLSV